MLTQVMNYENLIPLFVGVMAHCPVIILDVVPYVLTKVLTNPSRRKVNIETGMTEAWFQNVIGFAGVFFGEKHRVSLEGILNLVREAMRSGDFPMFSLLPPILSHMSGLCEPDPLTDFQLLSTTAGSRLRLESLDLTSEVRRFSHSAKDLLHALARPSLPQYKTIGVELMVAAVLQSRAVVSCLRTSHVKLLGLFSDQLIAGFVKMRDFLKFETKSQVEFVSLLPEAPIHTILAVDGVTVAHAMHVCRSAYKLHDLDAVEKQLEGRNASIPLKFFALFWLLSSQDIIDPSPLYESTIRTLTTDIRDPSKTQREVNRLTATKSDLESEQATLASRRNTAAALLLSVSSSLAGGRLPSSEVVQVGVMQHCILPRVVLTPADALYCGKFIEAMQKVRFAGFDTQEVLVQAIALIVPCVYCTTEREAEMIGHFLKAVFVTMREWEEGRFAGECEGTLGFAGCGAEAFREKMMAGTYNRVSAILCSCFESSDYMKQRNSLVILWKLVPEFPTSLAMADQLLLHTRKVAVSGTSDLKVLSQRYCDKLARLKLERWGEKLPSPSVSTSNRPSPSPGLLSCDEANIDSAKRPRDDRSITASSEDQSQATCAVPPKKRSRFS